MILLEFIATDGSGLRSQGLFTQAKAPRIGEEITAEGSDGVTRTWRRTPPDIQGFKRPDRHFVSHSLPYGYKPHTDAGGKLDSQGRCLFDSWRELEETEARANEIGENLQYDESKRLIGRPDGSSAKTKEQPCTTPPTSPATGN